MIGARENFRAGENFRRRNEQEKIKKIVKFLALERIYIISLALHIFPTMLRSNAPLLLPSLPPSCSRCLPFLHLAWNAFYCFTSAQKKKERERRRATSGDDGGDEEVNEEEEAEGGRVRRKCSPPPSYTAFRRENDSLPPPLLQSQDPMFLRSIDLLTQVE